MMSWSGDAAALQLQESEWKELQREARKLEGDLDANLSSYVRLTTHSSSAVASPTADRSSWKSMEFEIHSLLGKLQDVNDGMSRCASSAASVSQKLVRHRDILHEFTQEFRRMVGRRWSGGGSGKLAMAVGGRKKGGRR